MSALPLSYVLPLRWTKDEGLQELIAYLKRVSELVDEVIVVDGSPEPVFERHARALGGWCGHMRPDSDLRFAMGKVNGVTTGVRAARHERVVIADDDVRHDAGSLERIALLLEQAELVRPQNYFEPLTWHARWDTGRVLLNRVLSGDPSHPAADFPGTLGVRRSAFIAMGGYDGDRLFENLELIRTVEAAGGHTVSPLDLYVARRPPDTARFLSQRVRQAYDDFALPARMALFLSAGPALAAALLRRRWWTIAGAWLGVTAIAEIGRRRAGGGSRFPVSASLLAPLWVLERAVCSWLAVRVRLLRGGVRYGESVLARSASGPAELRARLGGRDVGSAMLDGGGSSTGPLAAVNPTSL